MNSRPKPEARTSATEVRAHSRVDLEVEVTMESDHNFYTGFSGNISEGGLFVATHQLLPAGSRLNLRLSLPPEDALIDAFVEVRWIRDERYSNLPSGIGLRFLQMSEDARAAISRFVERREALFYEE